MIGALQGLGGEALAVALAVPEVYYRAVLFVVCGIGASIVFVWEDSL